MTDTPPNIALAHVERQLVDVVARHQHAAIALGVDDFTDRLARECWAALLDIWAFGDAPTVRRVALQVVARTGRPLRFVALDVVFLPTGDLAHVEDYVAVIADTANRRRARVALAEAQLAIERGADPAAVIGRLRTVA